MMPPESILEAQTEALLQRVAREQESRCRRARAEAETQALSIRQRAREEARARLRQAIDEERRQFDRALAERRAALDTDSRRARQAVLREVLEGAWQRLPYAIAERWSDAAARDAWCLAACDCARQRLHPGAALRIEVDPLEVDGIGARATALLTGHGSSVEVVTVAGLGPGLRVRGGQACIDATVAGLLASREQVEARLLAELERRMRQDTPAGATP